MDTPYVREQKKVVGAEVVAWSKGVIGNVEKPVVITGPSGVGKGTLISMLMKEFPSMFGFSVSHTTRAPRAMEKDGVHYHFTERSVMEKAIKDGKFLEFASVHGNLYGTSVEAVEAVADAGKVNRTAIYIFLSLLMTLKHKNGMSDMGPRCSCLWHVAVEQQLSNSPISHYSIYTLPMLLKAFISGSIEIYFMKLVKCF